MKISKPPKNFSPTLPTKSTSSFAKIDKRIYLIAAAIIAGIFLGLYLFKRRELKPLNPDPLSSENEIDKLEKVLFAAGLGNDTIQNQGAIIAIGQSTKDHNPLLAKIKDASTFFFDARQGLQESPEDSKVKLERVKEVVEKVASVKFLYFLPYNSLTLDRDGGPFFSRIENLGNILNINDLISSIGLVFTEPELIETDDGDRHATSDDAIAKISSFNRVQTVWDKEFLTNFKILVLRRNQDLENTDALTDQLNPVEENKSSLFQPT